MRKRFFSLFLVVIMFSFLAISCSDRDSSEDTTVGDGDFVDLTEQSGDSEDLDDEPEPKGIFFEEEDDDATINLVEKDPSAFVGSWTATSDKAVYLYGNVDITVNKNGTWTGDITGEELGGTWEKVGDHIHMNDELFSFDLGYDSSGNMLLIETGDDGDINTVMTRK